MAKANFRILTNSERSSSQCWRRWRYRYHEGLIPADAPPAPLVFGSLIHRCVEFWREAGMPATGDFSAVLDPWLEGQIHQAQIDPYRDPAEAIAEAEAQAKMAAGIMAGYVATYAHEAEWMEIVSIEPHVARRVMHPTTGKPLWDRYRDPKTNKWRRRAMYMGGRIDLLYRDKRSGRNWIRETKTTIEKNLLAYSERALLLDPQTRGYAWALAQPARGLATNPEGLEVSGVVYDVIRKSVPKTPKTLKKGGISRAQCDTTRQVYIQAVLDSGGDPEEYREFWSTLPEGLSPAFFHLTERPFGGAEIADAAQDFAAWALDARDHANSDRAPRQTRVCQGVAAMPCKYMSLCATDMPLGSVERVGFKRSTVRHAELAGDMAEPGFVPAEKSPLDEIIDL